jgi:hypothetical protein
MYAGVIFKTMRNQNGKENMEPMIKGWRENSRTFFSTDYGHGARSVSVTFFWCTTPQLDIWHSQLKSSLIYSFLSQLAKLFLPTVTLI